MVSSVLPAVDKSPCWLGNKSDEPWAVADFIAKLARVLSDDRQLEQRPMRVRARARARPGVVNLQFTQYKRPNVGLVPHLSSDRLDFRVNMGLIKCHSIGPASDARTRPRARARAAARGEFCIAQKRKVAM